MKIGYNDKYYNYFMYLILIGILTWGIVTKQFNKNFVLFFYWFLVVLLLLFRSLLCYLNNKIYLSLQHLTSSFIYYTIALLYSLFVTQNLSKNEFSKLLGKVLNLPPDTAFYLSIFVALLPVFVSLFLSKILVDHKEAIEKIERERKEQTTALENLSSEYWKLSR